MNKKYWSYIDKNRNFDYVEILRNENSFKDYINEIKENLLEYQNFKNPGDFKDFFTEEITEDLNSHLIYDYQYHKLIDHFGIDSIDEKIQKFNFEKIRPAIYLLLEEAIYEKIDELNFFDEKSLKKELQKQHSNKTKTLKMKCK